MQGQFRGNSDAPQPLNFNVGFSSIVPYSRTTM